MGVVKRGISGAAYENNNRRSSVPESIVSDENSLKSQDEFLTAVGRQILLLRTSQNYTRESLAERADISAKYLYEIENGIKSFSAYILYRLLQALNVSLDSANIENPTRINDDSWIQLLDFVNKNGFTDELKLFLQIVQNSSEY